ncbi:hypothetical protein ALC57_18611, partial [Trachymyrmex cornetzi]
NVRSSPVSPPAVRIHYRIVIAVANHVRGSCIRDVLNAVGKMRSLALVLTSFNLLQVVVRCQELSVIRHSDGDIFTIEGSCTEACTVLSSGTASPFSRGSSSSSLLVPNSSCTCQCNFDLPIFREDLHICVNDIHGNVPAKFLRYEL